MLVSEPHQLQHTHMPLVMHTSSWPTEAQVVLGHCANANPTHNRLAYGPVVAAASCAAVQAFLYQVKMETLVDEPPATRLAQVSLADIMM